MNQARIGSRVATRVLLALGLTAGAASSVLAACSSSDSTNGASGGSGGGGAASSSSSAPSSSSSAATTGSGGAGGDMSSVSAASGESSPSTSITAGASSSSSAGGAGGQGGAGGSSVDTSSASGMGGLPCPRRPFLVRSQPRSADAIERGDWLGRREAASVDGLDEATARALAAAWIDDGCQEHASVAAFARFTTMLLAVGAPPDLVAGSQRASLDEIEHARLAFELGRRYGAVAKGPGAVDVRGAYDAIAGEGLADALLELAIHEGCVGETVGVVMAEEQLARATDPFVRAALRRIVRDEQRHAELAWRFARWAIATGGPRAQEIARRAFEDAHLATLDLDLAPDPEGVDAAAWLAHGRLPRERTLELCRRALDTVVAPCAAVLLGAAPMAGVALAVPA